jgi:hypothetical protein
VKVKHSTILRSVDVSADTKGFIYRVKKTKKQKGMFIFRASNTSCNGQHLYDNDPCSSTFQSLLVTWCKTFNNSTLYPHCIYVFCIYLRTNRDLCHLQHKLTGFYNLDGVCLLRGTNRVFKWSSLRFVFEGLIKVGTVSWSNEQLLTSQRPCIAINRRSTYSWKEQNCV